ncbi:MAG: SDR family NAD(P)-dependent oxidoreductase [Aeromicrobium sp.]
MKDLTGRTALLTGASGGIGLKIAAALADAGANVVVSGRREAALAEAAASVTQRGRKAAVVPADLSDFEAINPLVAAAEAALGPIDILVNNAGIEIMAPFTKFTRDELTSLIDVNLTSPMLLTSGCFPGWSNATPAASCSSLRLLGDSLRVEYADTPIGFSAVSPGYVGGDGMFQRIIDSGVKPSKIVGMTTTERVAAAVVRAIRRDLVEVLITGSPARPIVALGLIAPKTQERLLARLGMHRAFAEAARLRGRLG